MLDNQLQMVKKEVGEREMLMEVFSPVDRSEILEIEESCGSLLEENDKLVRNHYRSRQVIKIKKINN